MDVAGCDAKCGKSSLMPTFFSITSFNYGTRRTLPAMFLENVAVLRSVYSLFSYSYSMLFVFSLPLLPPPSLSLSLRKHRWCYPCSFLSTEKKYKKRPERRKVQWKPIVASPFCPLRSGNCGFIENIFISVPLHLCVYQRNKSLYSRGTFSIANVAVCFSLPFSRV